MATQSSDSFTSLDPSQNIRLADIVTASADPVLTTHGFQLDPRSCVIRSRGWPSIADVALYPQPGAASDPPGSDELENALNFYGPVIASGEGRHTSEPVNMAQTIAEIKHAVPLYLSGQNQALLRHLCRTLFGGAFPMMAWVNEWEANQMPKSAEAV